jgi:hypothetical protein
MHALSTALMCWPLAHWTTLLCLSALAGWTASQANSGHGYDLRFLFDRCWYNVRGQAHCTQPTAAVQALVPRQLHVESSPLHLHA